MGRKALSKKRLLDKEKQEEWVKILMPFFEQGRLKQITTDEIAAVLGVSKATIYKYYSSWDEILEAAIEYKLDLIREYKNKLSDESKPYIERYFDCIQVLLENLSGISNLFLSDLKKHHGILWKKIEVFIEEAVGVLKEYYKGGIEAGIFRDINPAILVLSDQLFFNALSDPEFLVRHNISIENAFADYFNLKLNGLLVEKRLETSQDVNFN